MRRFAFLPLLLIVVVDSFVVSPTVSWGQRGSRERVRTEADLEAEKKAERAMAAYADAANFQTGGAIALAIEAWQAFLKDYPDHEMASQAAHYLGVCYMQQNQPDYAAAANSFATALRDDDYELREESLANYGWCLYADAGQAPDRDARRLRSAIKVFQTLRKEFPESDFLDRAYFYTGEAYYGLGDAARAVQAYDAMLAAEQAAESPLRCDALYARGVALEELKEFEKAKASFGQLLQSCAGDDLATDVHLRMGDLAILNRGYADAIESFGQAFDTADQQEDQAYALFRQAFAFVKSEQPERATENYEKLLAAFPDSRYAASATLASAQNAYRSGDMDMAAERFEQVLTRNNPEAATEAAHWLARIRLSQGDPTAALRVAEGQVEKGAEGEFATALRLDLAEAYAADPKTVPDGFELFKKIHQDSPNDPLAPRALYNAAFFALQLGRPDEAAKLSDTFENQYSDDALFGDVGFIGAEAELAAGNVQAAARRYEKLIADTSLDDNPQRPLWILRGGATLQRAGRPDAAIEMLQSQSESLARSAQQAEAELLIGQAHLAAGRAAQAAGAFRKSRQTDDDWARAGEAALLEGTALRNDGQIDQATRVWTALADRDGSDRMADQARFKLGQLAAEQGDHARAVEQFTAILRSGRDPGLIPYATYGKARAEIAKQDFQAATETLGPWLKATETHPLKNEAMMAQGIALRNLDDLAAADDVFSEALAGDPRGAVLAGLLYESALVDVEQENEDAAIRKLRRVIKEVPGYREMDKVAYELGWTLREAGQEDQAEKQFRQFLKDFADSPDVAEAAYFVAQREYGRENWVEAAKHYELAADRATETDLSEKALYRTGWARFKADELEASESAFRRQAEEHPDGRLLMDALMMIGESSFKAKEYARAIESYSRARTRIRQNGEDSRSLKDAAERQVRELILLHGGQSAALLKKWDEALGWYGELRQRFPNSAYLAQVFYETAYVHQQSGDPEEALKFYGQVAQKYRNSVAARSRFMMGEIYFDRKQYDQAITEFQRVMFGFGADKAPASVKTWQAKSGYEAARCSEQLMQQAKTGAAENQAKEFAVKFYSYVIEKHPGDELAGKAADRLKVLKSS